jgi:hypothetical protein
MAYYNVLEIENKRVSSYKTLYYDTENYRLYTMHHNGQLNRYKIRHRTYVESGLGFLEIKFKTNKGQTIKKRIAEQTPPQHWEGDAQFFLNNLLPFNAATLKPAMWVNYNRLTLVSKQNNERLTIDVDVEFTHSGTQKKMNHLVVAEVKQEKPITSPFLKVMKKHHIQQGSISKYCMGMALTCNSVKKNNFKQTLQTLKNIIYDDFITSS